MTENSHPLFITFDNKKIVIIALAIQIAFLCTLGLDWLNLEAPILREVLGFIYLTIIPGTLILRALNAKGNHVIEEFLYAVGLSLVSLMILGLVVNFACPIFGIQDPISIVPLTVAISSFCSFLCVFVYRKSYQTSIFINLSNLLSIRFLLLLLLPFLSIIGAYLTHYHNTNIILLLLLILISLIPIFVVLNKIPKELYLLSLFVISFSLLFHVSLSTPYIFGRDINGEYQQIHFVLINSHLDFTQGSFLAKNQLSSIVILGPIFSILPEISLTWVLKLIYPFFSCLISLGLYCIFRQQTSEKIAFLSCFLFISYSGYFVGFLESIRRTMSIFFLVLLLLIMVSRKMDETKKSLLSILFTFALVNSHYGVPYIFWLSGLVVLLLFLLGRRVGVRLEKPSFSNFNFLIFAIVLTLAWFIYTEGRGFYGFDAVISVVKRSVQGVTELFSPVEKGSMYYIRGVGVFPSISHQVLKYLHHISQLFMVIGFLTLLYRKLKGNEIEYQDEFFLYSIVAFGWLGSALIFPVYIGKGSLGMDRMYQLVLLFIAPFCPIGFVELSRKIKKLKIEFLSDTKALKVFAVFLFVYLLFNTHLVMEVHREISIAFSNKNSNGFGFSIPLSQPRIDEGKCSKLELMVLYNRIPHELDVMGARWLGKYKVDKEEVFLDYSAVLFSYGGIAWTKVREAVNSRIQHGYSASNSLQVLYKSLNTTSYIFLKKVNYVDGIIGEREWRWWNTSEILPSLEKQKNKIYSNGGSVIYK